MKTLSLLSLILIIKQRKITELARFERIVRSEH